MGGQHLSYFSPENSIPSKIPKKRMAMTELLKAMSSRKKFTGKHNQTIVCTTANILRDLHRVYTISTQYLITKAPLVSNKHTNNLTIIFINICNKLHMKM